MKLFWLDLVDRLFERETLVVIGALYLLQAGYVTDVIEAVTLMVTVTSFIAGRSYVKANEKTLN